MQTINKAAINSTTSEGNGAGQLLTELRNGKYTLVKKKDYESDNQSTFTNGSITFSVAIYSDSESYTLMVVAEKWNFVAKPLATTWFYSPKATKTP